MLVPIKYNILWYELLSMFGLLWVILVHAIGPKQVEQEAVATEEKVIDESVPSSSTDVADAVLVIVFIFFSPLSITSALLLGLVIVPDDQIVVPRRPCISVDLVNGTVHHFIVLV